MVLPDERIHAQTGTMLTHVHEHIVSELGQSSRTDTIFVTVAVLFNLLVLGINSMVAGIAANEPGARLQSDLVLGILIAMLVLVIGMAINALIVGRRTRAKLLNGLLTMYRDNHVDQYYDSTLLSNYAGRYMMFIGVIGCLALSAIVIPLIIRLL